jgi:hypothetical protein
MLAGFSGVRTQTRASVNLLIYIKNSATARADYFFFYNDLSGAYESDEIEQTLIANKLGWMAHVCYDWVSRKTTIYE